MQQRLTKEALLDVRDDIEGVPLHIASEEGTVSTVLELLKAGASPTKTNAEERRCFYFAVSEYHF